MANAKLNTVGAVTNDSQSLGGSAPAINFALQRSIPISAVNVNKEPPTTAAGRLTTSDIQGNSSLGSIAALIADVKGSPLPTAMDT